MTPSPLRFNIVVWLAKCGTGFAGCMKVAVVALGNLSLCLVVWSFCHSLVIYLVSLCLALSRAKRGFRLRAFVLVLYFIGLSRVVVSVQA